jgi:hypothetical protein
MTRDRDHNADDAQDDGLRKLLQQSTVHSSAEHDAAVLHAAEQAANEIAARQQTTGRKPVAARTTPAWVRWTLIWLVPAAAVIAFVALIPGGLWGPPSQPGLADDPVRGAAGGIEPAHQSIWPEPPGRFQWPAVAEARGYRLIVRDAAAEPVWQSDLLERTDYRLAGEGLQRTLRSGGTFLWTVEAQTPGGIVELGPYWFRVEG